MAHKPVKRIVPGAKTAVILCHGIMGSPDHFRHFIPLIPEDWSVCCLLLDGHGKGVMDFARSIDVELQTSQEVLVAAARHKGTSVTEILQNCVIFNNGIHNPITDKEVRADRTIHLRHGEKMLFGKNMEKGLVRDGFLLKAVTVGEDGYTLDDVLVHDAHTPSNFLHQQLAMMDGKDSGLPLAIGVIRDVEAPTYEQALAQQIAEVRGRKNFASLREMILAGETWEVK